MSLENKTFPSSEKSITPVYAPLVVFEETTPFLSSVPYEVLAKLLSKVFCYSIESYCLRSTCRWLKSFLQQFMDHATYISRHAEVPSTLSHHFRLPKLDFQDIVALQENALLNRRYDSYCYLHSLFDGSSNIQEEEVEALVKGDHIACLDKLFASTVNPRQIEFSFIMCHAARYGSMPYVEYAIAKGADIRILQDLALRQAAEHGHLDVVKHFISLGADIWELEKVIVAVAANGHYEMRRFIYQTLRENRPRQLIQAQ